jgi:hypothetical protein
MFCLWFGYTVRAFAQAEVTGWGGLRGIRVDGELMAFTSGLRAVPPDEPIIGPTYLERLGYPHYSHDGNKQSSAGGIRIGSASGGTGGPSFRRRPENPLNGSITFEDTGPGTVKVDVQATANTNLQLKGVYFYLHLPGDDYSADSAQFIGEIIKPNADQPSPSTKTPTLLSRTLKGLRFVSLRRRLEIDFESPQEVGFHQEPREDTTNLTVCFPVGTGNLAAGQTMRLSFLLKTSGQADHSPVTVSLDAAQPGGPFEGVGGNFRLQNPADPPQIAYNLENLRVAWARVAMPLDHWWPNETNDPAPAAAAGHIDTMTREAMEMAGVLARKNIPLIISVWQAPAWALATNTSRGPGGGFSRSSPINPQKWDAVCQAIGSYLECLKKRFGAQPKLFSFNESDIGINVLQTPREHDETIKRLGAYFASRKLATKMLLGDTGNPAAVKFIDAALRDSEAAKYIGAVSFHSWNGGNAAQYGSWGAAARKLQVPLLVAEGGTDPAAYAYSAIFAEPWYALGEIGEYLKICLFAQPQSILQWQLTSDYSLLTGGKNGQPLTPTQRFWQLKQLNLTPVGARSLPLGLDQPGIAACAYVSSDGKGCAVHVVNPNASRPAIITGIPAGISSFHQYVTDATRGMKESGSVPVSHGTAKLTLDAMAYVTLVEQSTDKPPP